VLLIVWIAVVVLALVVLGTVAYGVFGALSRLGREATALQREVRPLLQQVQASAAAAEARRDRDDDAR
jgi:hypothetical protein